MEAFPEVVEEEDVFPRSTYNEKYDQDICTICQEDFTVGQEIVTLPCLHIFHADGSACPGVMSWISQTGTCPVCRTRVLNRRRPQWQANEFWVELSDYEREILRAAHIHEDDVPDDFIDDASSIPAALADHISDHVSALDGSWPDLAPFPDAPGFDFVDADRLPDLVDALPEFLANDLRSNRSSSSIYDIDEDIDDDVWLLYRGSTYEDSETGFLPRLVERSSSAESRFLSEDDTLHEDIFSAEVEGGGEELLLSRRHRRVVAEEFIRGRSCSTCSDRSRYTEDEDSVYDNSVYDDITTDEVDADSIWDHIHREHHTEEVRDNHHHLYRAESFEFLSSTSTQYERDYSISESWERDSMREVPHHDLIDAYYHAQPELITLRDLDSTESSYNPNELEDSGGSHIEGPAALLPHDLCMDFSRLCEASEELRLKNFDDISE